ncbi:MAG: M17 family peptidase N-terminal domain-containing protein, partial [Gammaproteobacteria bacterium]
MEFIIKSGNPEKQRTSCLIIGITESRRLTNAAKAIDAVSKKHLSNLLRRGDMDGKPGQSLVLYNVPGLLADRVLLVGCGRDRELDDQKYRKIIENSTRELEQTGATEAVSYLPELNVKGRDIHWKIRQAVEVT